MRLSRTTLALALAAATSSLGCVDPDQERERAVEALRPLYDRAIELSERISERGSITEEDRADVRTLAREIGAWNGRFATEDVRFGVEDVDVPEPEALGAVTIGRGPIVRTPGRGCNGWTCADSYWEVGFIFVRVCYLVTMICYTDGTFECEFDCFTFPWSLLEATPAVAQ